MKHDIAICDCGAPLIYTFAFSGAEYYCIECGSTHGMFEIGRAKNTPKLAQRLKQNEKKFEVARKGLLSGGVMFRNCKKCDKTNEPHLRHATKKEVAAHEAAIKRLNELATRED